jgi:hypothetical protein
MLKSISAVKFVEPWLTPRYRYRKVPLDFLLGLCLKWREKTASLWEVELMETGKNRLFQRPGTKDRFPLGSGINGNCL